MEFVIYSKPACPQCDQAKQLLKSKGVPYIEKKIDFGQERDPRFEYVELSSLKLLYPGIRMAPVITKEDGEFVGSLPELKRLVM